MQPLGTDTITRPERLALAWICCIGLACRIAAIAQPIRYDEAVTWLLFTSQSWWTIVSTYPNPNNHVLFSVLAKATSALAPAEPWALRLPAFVAGVMVVPLTWAVGRRLADRATALVGAALATGSTSLVLYSTNARGHTIVCVVALLLVLLGAASRECGDWRIWAAYSVVGALGLYTVPVTIYPLGAVSLWLGLDALHRVGRDPRALLRALLPLALASAGVLALAALLYSPILLTAGLGALTSNKLALPLAIPHFLRLLPSFLFELVVTWTAPFSPWCAPVVLALAAWGIRSSATPRRASLAIATIAWCVGLLCLTHRTPFVRFWLSVLPLFLLAVARGLVAVARRIPAARRLDAPWAGVAVATAVGALALTTRAAETSDDTGTFRSASAVVSLIGPALRPGDRVLAVIPLNAPLLYHLGVRGLGTGYLTTPDSLTRRRFVVLEPSRGQTFDWAVRVGLLDPRRDEQPRLVGRPGSAEVWTTLPRGSWQAAVETK